MSHITKIKPEFFLDENLSFLDPETRLLFIGLWILADKEGCLEYHSKKIQAQILPYDENIDIELMLNNLRVHGFINVVSTDKEYDYIQIVDYKNNQNFR